MRFATILLYALPAIPLAALTLPLYIIIPTFYTETLGLPLATVGLLLLLVRVLDAVNDPLIGWFADRVKPRFGRRRTVFALGLPVAGLAALMLFAPPADASALYLFGWACVLTIGYTAVFLPYSAWGAELSSDYSERSRIAGIREALILIGTLIAISIPFALGMDDANSWHGLAVLGIVVAIGLVLLGAIAVWRVPEPQEYSIKRLDFKEGLSAMRANVPFMRLIIAFLVNSLANGIPATLFLYFVSSVLGDAELRGPLLFVYFAAGIAGVPLALFVAKRMGKHRAWCTAMIIACAIFATVPFLGEGDVTAFAIICVLTGLCLGFDLVLPSSIQADVIDVDTAASGEQRSGIYFASWSLATKMSLALGVGLVFPMLALFGFSADAGAVNAPSALLSLALIYSWVPIALKLVAISLMWNFPLNEENQQELRRKIEAARA